MFNSIPRKLFVSKRGYEECALIVIIRSVFKRSRGSYAKEINQELATLEWIYTT